MKKKIKETEEKNRSNTRKKTRYKKEEENKEKTINTGPKLNEKRNESRKRKIINELRVSKVVTDKMKEKKKLKTRELT